jgi:hypothetical protein
VASPEQDIEQVIHRLDVGIRQLKVQYDMFFAGAQPREPVELRAELEKLIKQASNLAVQKYALRFHFNALVSRYNRMSEMWSRSVRNLEEGGRRPPAVVEPELHHEKLLARCRVGDADREQQDLRRLHDRYIRAREAVGQTGAPLPFERFVAGIASQTRKLKSEGAKGVELRLVQRGDKVQLRARPAR